MGTTRNQTCPSCGARYNVARLDPGAYFECRRCGATVIVGERATAAGGSWALAVAGFLVLVALFLHRTGSGDQLQWPWERFQESTIPARVGMVLWAVVGVVALVAGLARGRRWGGGLVLGIGGVLLLTAGLPAAPFPLNMDPPRFLMLAGLLASGLLAAGGFRGPATRGLAVVCGVGLLVWHGMARPGGASGVIAFRDLQAFLEGTLSEEARLTGLVLPILLQIAAAVVGVVMALGLARVWSGVLLVSLLLAAMLLPGAARIGEELGSVSGLGSMAGSGARVVAGALVQNGLALWLLLGAAGALVARPSGGGE